MLNLSTSTVSRALSDHPDISDRTKQRVRDAADQFNYTTNVQARFFRKQHSGLIALILPEVNMFFTPNLIKGVNEAIADSNYSLIIFLTDDSHVKEKEIIKQCLSWAVAGVLISLASDTKHLDHLAPLNKASIKCVLLDKTIKDAGFPTVTIDSVKASCLGVSHLIKKGHQQILGIFGNPNFAMTQLRIEGYKKAFEENGIPIRNEQIVSVNKSDDLDYILPPVLSHNKEISAIFTMSDELLIKSLYHIKQLGLSIPIDQSIVSVSDGIFPYLSHPQITYVKDSGQKMGQYACEVLFAAIAAPLKPVDSGILVAPKLIELASVYDKDAAVLREV